MMFTRPLAWAAAGVASLALGAGAGAGTGWTVRFNFVPARAYQGQPAAVTVVVKPTGTRCNLLIRYADGTIQQGLGSVRATSGLAKWSWTLAAAAPVGPARASVVCGSLPTRNRMFTVVGGTVAHSKLTVPAKGWSQRPSSYGPGSSVSYGVQLHNPSTSEDAQNVTVLVNFVDGGNHVMQTATTRIPDVAAGTTFNLGGSASLPGQTPVAKLEVVVQTKQYAKSAPHVPATENVVIDPSQFDPKWVGEVDGTIVNDDASKVLTNAQLSVVLFDATGAIVGGGTGYVFAALPPGTRAYFSATTGFSSIGIDRASTAAISVEPTYATQ